MIQRRESNSGKNWIIISLLSLAVPMAIYLLVDLFYAGDESQVQIHGVLSGVIAAVSFIALTISAVAAHKLKGKAKFIPIGGAAILFLVLCLSLFSAAFSGFAGSY